jgi:hypothetical protein
MRVLRIALALVFAATVALSAAAPSAGAATWTSRSYATEQTVEP